MGAVDYADLLVLTMRLLGRAPARAPAAGRDVPLGAGGRAARHQPGPGAHRRGHRRGGGQPDGGGRPRPVDLLVARRRPARWWSASPPSRARASSRCRPTTARRPEVVALAQATLPAGNRFGKRLHARPAGLGRTARWSPTSTSVQDEARFVVQRIADLITEGRAPGEIAVLYRAHHHSGRPAAGPRRGRRGVRAVLGRPLRGERPREGRARLLPPAPQPARRAGLASRPAPVRSRRRGHRAAGVGRDRLRPGPAGGRRGPAADGRRGERARPLRGGDRGQSRR